MKRVLVVVCVLVAVGACAAPRQTLGTRNSPCFRSLPTARSAVHDNGRLVGVRRVERKTVLRSFADAPLPPGRGFCVVAFSDDYRNDKVDKPAGSPIGKYAVTIITGRGTTLIKTYLVDELPFRMRHR